MENLRAIRSRIKSVESTGQLSRSMKMISASKLSRNRQSSFAMRSFSEECARLLSGLLSSAKKLSHPLLPRTGGVSRRCYVLFTGNRGLCGTYNRAVLHYMQELTAGDDTPWDIVVCGRWGRDNVPAAGFEPIRVFDGISDTPDAKEAAEVSDYLRELYLSGRADEIVLVYQLYYCTGHAKPGTATLLPLCFNGGEAARDYILEPDGAAVLNELAELCVGSSFFSALLESKMSEHFARMSAMNTAADNTEQLVEELTGRLNRARQQNITTELSEIINGGEEYTQRSN